ncbi:uncharacterized protein LOC124461019, partial [Drosophila willistoni]|uniref:uncharacterized protein LOC124461019 n=1 Tax=Drosophila willistoni TaxID=7260 RepID=UPI001F08677F
MESNHKTNLPPMEIGEENDELLPINRNENRNITPKRPIKAIRGDRFIGRRGIPKRIYCDNATNFVGACSQLEGFKRQFCSELNAKNLEEFSRNAGFEFNFIPPRAPHFGGLWEAAVKSMKTLLIKNLTSSHLTYEELQSIAIEVEAILNSRPISIHSDDPNDGEALTPAHLLIGCSLQAIPEPVTYLKQRFWELWKRDYVHQLQERSKWLHPENNIAKDQLVLIHEDNLHRNAGLLVVWSKPYLVQMEG